MNIEFLKSLYDFAEYRPFGLPEFAFGGRSNVGKSSLINKLFNHKIAHTGKTPGKTRCVNFFRAGKAVIADLPGYGYARVPKEEQRSWKLLIESYIEKSPELKMVFILVDIQRGIGDEEAMLMEWLDHIGRSYRIVFTKTDKVSSSARASVRKKTAAYAPVFFSAVTGEGKKEILEIMGGRHVS